LYLADLAEIEWMREKNPPDSWRNPHLKSGRGWRRSKGDPNKGKVRKPNIRVID
jgi:hypothetical protein